MTSIPDALSAYFAAAREVNDLIARVGRSDADDAGLRLELDEARDRRAEALSCLRDAGPSSPWAERTVVPS